MIAREAPGKIGIVVQRYGANINGGAELHARYIAEHLAKHVEVEVLTTCATDYITWRNALNPGPELVNGVAVRRFPVVRERDPDEFGQQSARVFTTIHSLGDELAWLEAEGPTSPALIEHIRAREADYEFFIFFSFRYYHAYHGIRAVAAKSILVPTAERDGALGLDMFRAVFRSVRAFMYNSLEERALIQQVAQNTTVPGIVVGVGSEIPPHASAIRFRQKFGLRDRFAIYIGRIDENKGCAELFDYFQRYARLLAEGLHLVLIGSPIIPIPQHPRIHHLGFVSDQDKFDALAAAELLIMPSYFESLSMVALEAWALGKPVLANGQCDVLRGQCIRSNGGLYYDNFAEFVETLRAIDFSPSLSNSLGRNGREYFQRNYAWPIIERKYLDMLDRLRREPAAADRVEPLPGWFARRRRTLAPAHEVVAKLPRGAVLSDTGLTPTPPSGGVARPSHTMPPPRDERRAADAGEPDDCEGGGPTNGRGAREHRGDPAPRDPRERHRRDRAPEGGGRTSPAARRERPSASAPPRSQGRGRGTRQRGAGGRPSRRQGNK